MGNDLHRAPQRSIYVIAPRRLRDLLTGQGTTMTVQIYFLNQIKPNIFFK